MLRNLTASWMLLYSFFGHTVDGRENDAQHVPLIAQKLPEFDRFLDKLNADVKAGTIDSNDQLIERCRRFYTPERMAEIEKVLPGWGHMSSFTGGKTLWHINAAMLALVDLEEYRAASREEQIVMEWTVLLHDMAKEPVNGRDHRHPIRSAALAGRLMPKLGFPVTDAYASDFSGWYALTDTATRFDEALGVDVVDNGKLPRVFDGMERMFAEPTTTIVRVIALHQSVTALAAWPAKAPLTDEEVKAYIDEKTRRLLLVMMLADSGGWNLFEAEKLAAAYQETRLVFRRFPVARVK